MIDTNKMRDAFEVAMAKQAAEDGFAKPSLRRNKNNGDYVDPFEQAAWWGWQASREALVIDLNCCAAEVYDGSGNLDFTKTVEAIEAQGLKVAP